jgi:hypothetical protein
MALDIYYKEDILNALRGLHVAGAGSASLMSEILADPELQDLPLDKLLRVYQRGFNTGLVSVALSFGLDETAKPQVGRTQHKELDAFIVLLKAWVE